MGSCEEYLNLVVKYAGYGGTDEREVRRRALRNLGVNKCRKALLYLIEKYAGYGGTDEREVRRMAFDYLEKLDREE